MTDTTYDNSTELDPRIAARLKRDAKGLVAAVIQQYDTREVLMVGYMNDVNPIAHWCFNHDSEYEGRYESNFLLSYCFHKA